MAGLFEDFNPLQRVASNQYGISTNTITSGSLISFSYPNSWATIPNVIHDPYPMVLITDIWPRYIRGVNLHYLTFPYIKRLLTSHGGRPFNYQMNIKADKYLANSFRMYVRQGIKSPKRLDTEFLLNVLGSVRSFAPGELERIRMSIQQQIQQRLQAKADELTAYEQWRSSLTESQKRQLRGKGLDTQRTLTGGVDRGLINPNEGKTGLNPSQFPPQPGEGGPMSTDPNL